MKAKFYHLFFLLSLFAVAGLTGCEKDLPEPFLPEATEQIAAYNTEADPNLTDCEPASYTLWAGQHINTGSLEISSDQDYIYVTFSTTGGWMLQLTHLHIATSVEEIPKNGRPVPGQFQYQTVHNPRVTEYTYAIPNTWAEGQELIIAAHAEVVLIGENGNIVQGETAFGGNTPGPGNRWWFYAEYLVEYCDDTDGTIDGDGSGEDGDDEGGDDGNDEGGGDENDDGGNEGDDEGGTDGDDDGGNEGEDEGGDEGGNEGDGGDEGGDEGGDVPPIIPDIFCDNAWAVDTVGGMGTAPSQLVNGTYFLGISAYCTEEGHPNGFIKPIVGINAEGEEFHVGNITIYNPLNDQFKSTGNLMLGSFKNPSNAPSNWYVEITVFDNFDFDEAGFYIVNTVPGSFSMDNFVIKKSTVGSNTVRIYLNDAQFNQVDFEDSWYVAAFAGYCTTNETKQMTRL